MTKENLKSIGIVIVVIILLSIILGGCFSVNVGKMAIKFNKITGSLYSYNCGTYLKIPFIESISKFDIKTIKSSIQTEGSSRDLQVIHITAVLNYKIDNTKINNLYSKIGIDFEEKVIIPISQEILKQHISKFNVEEIITNRENLKNNIEISLKNKLKENYIYLENISLTNLQFSEEFNKVVEQKQIEEQKIKTAEYKKRQAEENKKRIILEAEAEAEKQRLLKSSVNQEIISLKWIEKWNGELPKTMLGDKNSLIVNPKDNK
jgi:regulator of protease activity HflC (stomatin/prohibitin superfamily)